MSVPMRHCCTLPVNVCTPDNVRLDKASAEIQHFNEVLADLNAKVGTILQTTNAPTASSSQQQPATHTAGFSTKNEDKSARDTSVLSMEYAMNDVSVSEESLNY